RDEFMGALGRLDAGDPSGAQHIAFFGIALAHDRERLRLHDDAAFGDGDPLGRGFGGDVDHAGFTAGAKMTELVGSPRHDFHRISYWASAARRARSARVAAVTSFCRIRLSPTRKAQIPILARLARSLGANIP